ncbi:hypothetical protein PISL3812_09936 [Talaromyces islandicus]|uniref:Uncharacterized protein n=1 Tax=Talaromyces islandicus TaxID=28573 RepID=A0A0U1MB81_TALIS|nr:hypothetical protein PISL3812_09936 [Talaromyces islandicus]
MAENKILKTDQSHATANSTLQLSSGTYQPKWIPYEETGLDDYLRDNGFSIFDICLSVKLGDYKIYEVLVHENGIGDLGKLFKFLEPFHKDSLLVHEKGQVEAFRITYHSYKTYKANKAGGLSPAEEEACNCRLEQFKPRLPELDMGMGSEPSDLDIRIYAINYKFQYIIIFDNNAGYGRNVQLHQLLSMNLASLKDFCEKIEPPEGRRSDPGCYDTNTFPTNWGELLKFHRTQWDQRKTSAAEPSQVNQLSLAQNHCLGERES